MDTKHEMEPSEASFEDESSFLGFTNDQPALDTQTPPSEFTQMHTYQDSTLSEGSASENDNSEIDEDVSDDGQDMAFGLPNPRTMTMCKPRRLMAGGHINGKCIDAMADSGASFSVMTQELADALGLVCEKQSLNTVYLPSGRGISVFGQTTGRFTFTGEETSHALLCVVLEKCIHPLVLGCQFLQATETMTRYTQRIRNVFSNTFCLNYFGVAEAQQQILLGFLHGTLANVLPDTGSDLLVMSQSFAEQLGLPIEDGPNDRTKVQFIDGSEEYTVGRVRGVQWDFRIPLDLWRKQAGRRAQPHYDFHIIEHLPVDVIANNDFIDDFGIYGRNSHRLQTRVPSSEQAGIYGIKYIESALRTGEQRCGSTTTIVVPINPFSLLTSS